MKNKKNMTKEEFYKEWESQFDNETEDKPLTWHCMYCKKSYPANMGSSDYCSVECGRAMMGNIIAQYITTDQVVK